MNQGVCVRNDDLIRELTAEGKTAKEIALAIGASKDSVRKYRIKHKYRRPRKGSYVYKRKKIETDKEIVIKLIAERKTYSEIAAVVGCTEDQIKYYCKKNKLKTESKGLSEKRKTLIISGVASGMSVVDIAERYNVSVPMVYKAAGGVGQYKNEHQCPMCGKITKRPLWCSDECARKSWSRAEGIRRRAKIKNAVVDRDITLVKLMARDMCICHICGQETDSDDFIVRDGKIICGNRYPSVDHVIPLSKGGVHSWENVRLAHRSCNSRKGSKIYEFGEMEAENNKADAGLRCVQ